VKVGTFGLFVVSALAVRQGTMWAGIYNIRKYDRAFLATTVMVEQTHTEGTFATKGEAEDAAFAEGESVVLDKRGRGDN
jgi:hypothetical protein